MPICRYCGSEYYSDSGRCFACGRFDKTKGRRNPYETRQLTRLAIGIVLILLGSSIAIGGVLSDGADSGLPDAATRLDPRLIAGVGVLMVSIGAGIASYSIFGVDASPWMIRTGKRSRSALAVFFLCFGSMTIALDAGLIAVSQFLSISTPSILGHALVLSVSALEMVTAYTGIPSFLFLVENFEEKREKKIVAGWTLVLSGVAILSAGVFYAVGWVSYGFAHIEEIGWIIPLWTFIIGFVVLIAGIGEIYPSGRWWIGGGALK